MDSKQTHGAPSYELHEIAGGKRYRLNYGPFASGMQARDFAMQTPRANIWFVVEVRDCKQHGIVFGTKQETVATCPVQ